MAVVPYRSTPSTATRMVPTAKLRSRKTSKLTMGSSVVISRTRNAIIATAETTASQVMKDEWNQSSSWPLTHARDDQHAEAGGRPARGRREGEDDDARHEKALAAEDGAEPGRGGEHDGVGDEIAREHPGGLRRRGGQAPPDVGEGHVG